ncbi:hypothetical protein MD484_g8695, partial [Candolleomyces efflorescens]
MPMLMMDAQHGAKVLLGRYMVQNDWRRTRAGAHYSTAVNFERILVNVPRVAVGLSMVDPFRDGPPIIFACLSGIELVGKWAVRVYTTNIDHAGFTCGIVNSGEEDGSSGNLRSAAVTWIAIPGSEVMKKRNVWMGSFATDAGVSFDLDKFGPGGYKGHVDFGLKFKRVPKIFVGLRQFCGINDRNFRLTASTLNVTTAGMDWKLEKWGDTKLLSAGANFLAVDADTLYETSRKVSYQLELTPTLPSLDVTIAYAAAIAILAPLLKKNSAAIKEIPFKTFQYGPTERHQLDVYYPLTPHPSGKTPILFFVYGGSFTTGARNLNAKFGLVYANLGAFFARQGIVTVIPDYRLVPNVVYPEPVEDVRDAMNWVIKNPSSLLLTGDGSGPSGGEAALGALQLDKLFILGHSAGAFHVGSLVFNLDILPLDSGLRSKIGGAALSGGPYDLSALQAGTPRGDLYQIYFGSVEEAKRKDILVLANGFPQSELAKQPDIVLIKAEEEPGFLDEASEELKKILSKKLEKDQKLIVAGRHNHISINWALGTGEGEGWAYELADWIWSKI